MEQINNENLEQKNQIEVGQIFFADIRNLAGALVLKTGLYVKDGIVDTITWGYGDNVQKVVDRYYRPNILLAVKYLGNGIFQEMTTGEKIITSKKTLVFEETESSPIVEKKLSDIDSDSLVIFNYEDYLIEHKGETVLSKIEYVQLLQNCMKRISETPLALSCGFRFREIDDTSKKIYLAYSDEERKSIIAEVKKMALLDAEEVNTRIANVIEKMKTISSEEVDMAYLDNQLFDFERKERTR